MAVLPKRFDARARILTGLALWLLGLLAAIALAHATASVWLLGAVLAVSCIGLALILTELARVVLRREGVERASYVEGSAVAFWVVVFGCFGYGLLDAFADVPAVNPLYVCVFALLSWSVSTASRSGRYS